MDNSAFGLETIKATTLRLLAYCRENDWTGYDPYDALNSRLLKALPFLNSPTARLLLSQAVKRSPVNLRPMLRIHPTPSPKALALFISSLARLDLIGSAERAGTISELAARLLDLRSPGHPYSCWGYTFDWQSRLGLVPRGSPNVICSTFAANALLDAYEQSLQLPWLNAAESAAQFVLNVLFWRGEGSQACFSYTPLGRTRIHNANLLGAALLCRVGRMTDNEGLIEPALDAARYSASRQHQDGSWAYGEFQGQAWIDNFHTGFNLTALKRIGHYGRTREFEASIRSGLDFYWNHFFRKDGAPKYYHDSVYPIDIHSVAQSILTLVELNDLAKENIDRARSVLNWALAHMWNARGYFYFQRHRYYTNRIPYIRWSQAWMLMALSTFLRLAPEESTKRTGRTE